MIELETWPQRWDGDEPTRDIMETVYQNGAMKPLIFRTGTT